jgi:hypothetical protein
MVAAKKKRKKRAKSRGIEKHMFKYSVFLAFPALCTRARWDCWFFQARRENREKRRTENKKIRTGVLNWN